MKQAISQDRTANILILAEGFNRGAKSCLQNTIKPTQEVKISERRERRHEVGCGLSPTIATVNPFLWRSGCTDGATIVVRTGNAFARSCGSISDQDIPSPRAGVCVAHRRWGEAGTMGGVKKRKRQRWPCSLKPTSSGLHQLWDKRKSAMEWVGKEKKRRWRNQAGP